MDKCQLTIVGITILFLGLAITPEILASENDKIDFNNDKVEIYKFARLKTTEKTGGYAFCFPGYLRSVYFIDSMLLHSFVLYDDDFWEGWYLTINGDEVSRGRGCIFGFTGRITNWYGGLGFKPDYCAFDLDGIALLIIHISD